MQRLENFTFGCLKPSTTPFTHFYTRVRTSVERLTPRSVSYAATTGFFSMSPKQAWYLTLMMVLHGSYRVFSN
jgi:hypothetical protein